MTFVADFEVGTADDLSLSRPIFDGLTLMQAGLAKLLHYDLDAGDTHEALELIDSVESLGRQLDAAKARVHESIDRTGVYAIDGHRGAKPMIANTAKLSEAEAAARQKSAKVLETLPLVADAYRRGQISSCMVRKLGRVHSNPRVRHLMADADDWFLRHALNDTYKFFDLTVSEWERLADEDGAEQRDARHERARNHTMRQNEEGEWEWAGSAAAYDGAISKDVFDAFEKIEVRHRLATRPRQPRRRSQLAPHAPHSRPTPRRCIRQSARVRRSSPCRRRWPRRHDRHSDR